MVLRDNAKGRILKFVESDIENAFVSEAIFFRLSMNFVQRYPEFFAFDVPYIHPYPPKQNPGCTISTRTRRCQCFRVLLF